jgi:hypothetical protein
LKLTKKVTEPEPEKVIKKEEKPVIAKTPEVKID